MIPRLALGFLSAHDYPIHNFTQGKTFSPTQSHRGKLQLQVLDIIGSRVCDRFTSDALNNFRRPVEQPKGLEFGEEIFEGIRLFFADFNQLAQLVSVGQPQPERASHFQQSTQPQRAFQMPVEIHFRDQLVIARWTGNTALQSNLRDPSMWLLAGIAGLALATPALF